MKRFTPFFAILCMALIALWGPSAWHPRTVSAYHVNDGNNSGNSNDNDGCQDNGNQDQGNGQDQDGRDGGIGSFLVTITTWGSSGSGSGSGGGAAEDRSVITLHRDKTMSAIDSNQGSGQFSSQLGAWKHGHCATKTGRTIEFNFANSTILRLDYQFDKQTSKDSISGMIVVTSFPNNADPLGNGGTVVANLEFTGTRIEVPPDKGQ